MKVTKGTKLASNATASAPKVMSKAQQAELVGLSINDAIERGLITELCDSKGRFIIPHADENIDAHYAIVNGYAVRVSNGVVDTLESVPETVGQLTFQAGISNIAGEGFGKEWFRLGLAAGIRLSEEGGVVLQVEPELTEEA